MTPEELGAALVAELGGSVRSDDTAHSVRSDDTAHSVRVDDIAYGVLTADVPPERWVDALLVARDRLGCTFFDWLSAVDEVEGISLVAHVYAVGPGHHLQLRTRLPAESPRIASAVGVFRGADWHERETHEMFGVVFDGHPNLVPLLLPDGFSGHPLRKDFVLAARVAKAWPGAKEPGEGAADAPSRRATLPPGVPAPGTWPAPEPEPESYSDSAEGPA